MTLGLILVGLLVLVGVVFVLVLVFSMSAAPVSAPSRPTVTPRHGGRAIVVRSRRKAGAIEVRRAETPYWRERGWREEGGGVYRGYFPTPEGDKHGCVIRSPAGRVEVFIHEPPTALAWHRHWPCFRAQGNGWFFVHPVTEVPDVSAGILAVEKTITEAYER